MTKQPVLGLGRHAETEAIGTPASPGTRLLFSLLEESLRRHFTLVPIPPHYHSTDARRSLRVAIDVLQEVDACLFGLPPGPFALDPFFLVRERLQKQTPFVYMPLGEFPRGAWCYRNIHRHLGRHDLVLFSCRADRGIHDALVASTPARVAVVPLGIRPEHFRRPPSERAVMREHLGISPSEVVFVYHGRVTVEKNVHGAIMLFRRIARDHPATRLWVIGQIEEWPGDFGAAPAAESVASTFKALLQADGLAERINFWGGGVTSEALPSVLGAADIAINLTVNGDECFGYSVVEAMAAGLPVIGTDWGGLKDTIKHGSTGFLVPTVLTPIGVGVDHWRAWQSALVLVENTERRLMMGAAAQARVARKFSLDRFAAAVARQVHAQISAQHERRAVRHAWSMLGRRFSEMYSTSLEGDPIRVLPATVPATRTLFADHPMMRKLLKPYATRTESVRRDRGAVFFLATELLNLKGASVRSCDPRYVFAMKLTNAIDRAVISVLKEHSFCDRSSLVRNLDARFDRPSVQASLRRLLRAGIVLRSTRMGDETVAVRPHLPGRGSA